MRVVPYQARHSGASLDAAGAYRTRRELKQQGRWASDSSVRRYEKRARLTAGYNTLPAATRAYLDRCEALLGDLFCGKAAPDVVASP